MIRVEGLLVQRGGGPILELPRLSVGAGELLLVQGRNGAGKTTLLKVLAGLERPDAGRVDVAAGPAERVLVHQAPYLFRGTVAGNVGYGLRARGVERRRRHELVAAELARLGAAHLEARTVEGLSGGEVRRVALARALVLSPRLLLLDEAFADLDPVAAELVEARLDAALADGAAVLVTTPAEAPARAGARAFELAAPAGRAQDPRPASNARPSRP